MQPANVRLRFRIFHLYTDDNCRCVTAFDGLRIASGG
jgi:hypothetical protein